MPTLSEADSKALLARFGLPVLAERLADDLDGAVSAADALGYPVVAKLCGDHIAHKTERGLVRLNLGDAAAVRAAAADLLAAATVEDGDVAVLVAPMVKGNRELIAGLADDPQFGMTVMVGHRRGAGRGGGRRRHPPGADPSARRHGHDRRAVDATSPRRLPG